MPTHKLTKTINAHEQSRAFSIRRSASAMGVKFGDTRPLAAQGMSVGVSVGGVTFNVDGASPDIMGEISAHIEDITDDIAGKLAEKLSAIHGNQARMAA